MWFYFSRGKVPPICKGAALVGGWALVLLFDVLREGKKRRRSLLLTLSAVVVVVVVEGVF
jgi:hypothetical protein